MWFQRNIRNKIQKVLEEYSTDFLFDFSCAKNRKALTDKLEKAIMETVPFKVGVSVLRKKKKTKKSLTT